MHFKKYRRICNIKLPIPFTSEYTETKIIIKIAVVEMHLNLAENIYILFKVSWFLIKVHFPLYSKFLAIEQKCCRPMNVPIVADA